MSWISALRFARRVDVRFASTLLVLAVPVFASVILIPMTYAAHEMLEERGELVSELADVLTQRIAATNQISRDPAFLDILERQGVALRILDGDHTVASYGSQEWFSRTVRDSEGFWDALRADESDVIVSRRAAGALRVEVAASLEHFTDERSELLPALWLAIASGLIGNALIAILATRYALQPLREATRVIAEVNANQLRTRLAVRGTNDVLDQHAIALNQALDRVESGLNQIRAFSADVAHELRTPINRLLNQSGALLLAEPDGGQADHPMLAIQDTAEEMQALVEGLLLLSQAEHGRLRTRAKPISVGSLLRGLHELYGPACEEVEIQLDIKDTDLGVLGDESLLVRALGNMLDNAIGHTPKGGSITITSTSDAASVSISVCDSGTGIPAQDLERIFDRFVRLDPTGPRRGAGLGLPIARAIAVAHGGGLSGRNKPGGGTCFDLRLPQPGRPPEPTQMTSCSP